MSAAASQSSAPLPADKLLDPSWAWAPFQPDAERPWNLCWAGHLYRRAAFAGNWEQLQTAVTDGPQATIDKLLHPPPDISAFNRVHDAYEEAAAQSGSSTGPQSWWLRRICETPDPFAEQMTLFWHNHFGISNTHVDNPALICRYLQVVRQHALQSFDDLLEAVLNEPAVFACVGARTSRKAKPNENLARVLLEQYTLGPGQFTEADMRQAARVLTGWFVSQNELQYSSREHAATPGPLLGETGDFDKKDLVRLLVRQPATAQLLVRELYRWFISETTTPSDDLIGPLATAFAKNRDTGKLVETMLCSNLFFSPFAYRQKIKSPVEFALGIIRPLNGFVGTAWLAADLADLGQDLYNPPTIKGWAGNRCWVNRFTLLGRVKLAQALLAGSGSYEGKLDPFGPAAKLPQRSSQCLFDLFVQRDLPQQLQQELAQPFESNNSLDQGRGLAARIAALPEFNLS